MRLYLPAAAACAALVLAGSAAAPAVAAGSGPSAAFRISDPRITESSGLAASPTHPGIYWTHNDSGDGPYVYAVDSATGHTVAKVTMRGVHARDVEAISIGPDDDIYVGDIGDNLGGSWPEVHLYRFPEPARLHDQSVSVTRYTVRYDGGPRDAEALMVQPKTGRVYIASKNQQGGHLYAGPQKLSSSGVNVFRPVADVPWVTDGSFSPDGSRLVLRGYFWAAEYRWDGDRPVKIRGLDVPMQIQGESVTYTADGRALMFGSEGKDSTVWRLPLTAASAAGSAVAPSATTGTGDGSAADKGTTSTQDTATKSGNRNSGGRVLGFAVLAAIFGAGYGLRRLRRRPQD